MSSTTMTWEQFFLDNALQTWAQYQAVRLDADAAGYTISEGTQTQLNSSAQQLETSAQQYGFDSVQAMLEADFGAGVTAETYQSYMELYMTSMDYYYSQMDALTPSAEEVEAYYDENQETFTQNGIDKNETPATINVRHILIQPEGEKAGTDDNGNAVYSEEQLAAAKEKAQALYDQWLAGEATEASFAGLVEDNSADTGSVSNGGLYEGVAPNQMVTEFNDWCFDPTRKAGDTGLVETQFGCHIMYFVSARENLLVHLRRVPDDAGAEHPTAANQPGKITPTKWTTTPLSGQRYRPAPPILNNASARCKGMAPCRVLYETAHSPSNPGFWRCQTPGKCGRIRARN